MSEIMKFEYNQKQIRSLMLDEDPWFVAKDVCDILGYRSYRKTLSRLDEDERGVTLIHSLGGMQETNIISESGLYSLILGSKISGARHFKRWVTHSVLPEIRKKGFFIPQTREGQLASALILANEVIQEQKREMLLQKPKINAFDTFLTAGTAQSMHIVAKFFNVGRNTLFAILREQDIFMRSNVPYQRYKKHFKVINRSINMGNDLFDNKPVTYVYPSGVELIRRILKKIKIES